MNVRKRGLGISLIIVVLVGVAVATPSQAQEKCRISTETENQLTVAQKRYDSQKGSGEARLIANEIKTKLEEWREHCLRVDGVGECRRKLERFSGIFLKCEWRN